MADLGRAVDLPVQRHATHIEEERHPYTVILAHNCYGDAMVIKGNIRPEKLEHFCIIDQVEQVRQHKGDLVE